MYLCLNKPTSSMLQKKNKEYFHLDNCITIYTNQLTVITHSQIAKCLISNEKFKILSHKKKIQQLSFHDIFLCSFFHQKTQKQWMIDYCLGQEINLKVLDLILNYPLYFQIIITDKFSRITSLTKQINFQMFGLNKNNFVNSLKENSVLIGKGSFSTIHLIRETATQKPLCLKLINKHHCSRVGQKNFIKNQYQFLTDPSIRYYSNSKFFINLRFMAENDDWVGFFEEWGVLGSLFDWINSDSMSGSSSTQQETLKVNRKHFAYFYFIQISLAICKLHRAGYIYRDLKPENVIIDPRGNAKLCDFGYTVKLKQEQFLQDICGSYQYLPPQLINKKHYNKSYDLYCLGLLFYQMLTQRNPFNGITPKNIEQIKKIKIEFNRKYIQQSAEDLIKCLMKQDPEQRIGYFDTSLIFKHKFFLQNEQMLINALFHDNCQDNSVLFSNHRLEVGSMEQINWQEYMKKEDNSKELKKFWKSRLFSESYNFLYHPIKLEEKYGPKIFLK